MSTSHFDFHPDRIQDSVVLYIDLLGVKGMTQAIDPRDAFQAFEGAIKAAFDRSRALGDVAQIRWFSDSILVAWPLLGPDLAEADIVFMILAEFAMDLQYQLYIEHGIALRGGIARGQSYVAGNVAFGPAIVDAYALESKIAKQPRIAVCRSLVQPKTEDDAFIVRDEDGIAFLDYLGFQPLVSGRQPEEVLSEHRSLVRKSLDQHPEGTPVHGKYDWISTYHDWICADTGHRYSRHLDDLMIDANRSRIYLDRPQP